MAGQSTQDAAERYASALFDLALEGRAVDAVAADLESVRAMLEESADLRRLIDNPAFTREDKEGGLTGVAQRARLGELATRFLAVLARNGRARALPEAIARFREKADAHRGVTIAEVASARALTPRQVEGVVKALKKATGKDVEVRASVRPELLGGLVVRVGSRMFDSSLRSKLEGLKAAMKGA